MKYVVTETCTDAEIAEVEANSLEDAMTRQLERLGYQVKEVDRIGGCKMSKITQKNEPGICPRCGHSPLNYGSFMEEEDGVGAVVIYPYTCPNCHFIGQERHYLTFAVHTDKDGEELSPTDN